MSVISVPDRNAATGVKSYLALYKRLDERYIFVLEAPRDFVLPIHRAEVGFLTEALHSLPRSIYMFVFA